MFGIIKKKIMVLLVKIVIRLGSLFINFFRWNCYVSVRYDLMGNQLEIIYTINS